MYDKLIQTFSDYWNSLLDLLPSLTMALIILLLFVLIGTAIHRLFKRTIIKRASDPFTLSFVGRIVKWTFYLIGLITALHVMGFSGIANSLLTGAGISALVVGFALKDIFENFLSGVLLAVNRPFHTGNIIEVAGVKGTVKALDLRSTHIRNIEGKDIYIPNSMLIKSVLVNYTKDGYLRLNFEIGLDVPTDVDAAQKLILDYLDQQPDILKQPKPDVVTLRIGSHTVDIEVLFWVNVLSGRDAQPSLLGITTKSRVIKEVKQLLLANGFNLPSPILEHKLYETQGAIPLTVKK